jgi:hypothetical protein
MALDDLLNSADEAAQKLLDMVTSPAKDGETVTLAERVKAFQAVSAYIESRAKPKGEPKPPGRPKKQGGLNGIRERFHGSSLEGGGRRAPAPDAGADA